MTMTQSHSFKRSAFRLLMGVGAAALILAGIHLLQAQQVTIQKKPVIPPPPTVTCTIDYACTDAEYDTSLAHASQLCADCKPQTYGPLQLVGAGVQAVTGYWDFVANEGRIYVYRYDGVRMRDVWASDDLGFMVDSVVFGDVDNDGVGEITASVDYWVRSETTGKGNNKVTTHYYIQKIFIFEDGSFGAPDFTYVYPGETTRTVMEIAVGDVDNDGRKELVTVRGSYLDYTVEMFEVDTFHNFEADHEGAFESYNDRIKNPVIGDADNDKLNELVLGANRKDAPVILKYSNGAWSEQAIDPVTEYGPKLDFVGIQHAVIGNVDDDEGNEIVCGGLNDRLMIWKYDGAVYRSVFVSEVLVQNLIPTVSVGIGDLKADAGNEIAVASSKPASSGEAYCYLFIYKFDGTDWARIDSLFRGSYEDGMGIGNLDGDGLDEIVSTTAGITVYEYTNNVLVETYNSALGYSRLIDIK